MFFFDNAGRRIQNVVNILFWISVVANSISAIFAGGSIGGIGGFFAAILLIALGFFVSWLSALLLYAFGELCENIMSIEDDTGAIRKKLEEMEKRSGDAKTAAPVSSANSSAPLKQSGKRFDPESYPAGPV